MFDFLGDSSDEETPPQSSSSLSVVGQGSTIKGTFDLEEDDLRVDGVLEGEVQTEGHVHVAQDGRIQGEIQAGSIRIAGRAEGVLQARQSLVLHGSSTVHGILCGEALTIDEGADFEGGICSSAERIPALKTIFSSTEVYSTQDLSSSPDETTADQGPASDGPSLPDPERPPSSDGEGARSTERDEAVPTADPSSVSLEAEETVVEDDPQTENGVEERPASKW